MYRCEFCRAVSLPRQPCLKHITERLVPKGTGANGMRREIACEQACCPDCKRLLDKGVTPGALAKAAKSNVSISPALYDLQDEQPVEL